jgi:hypothetical protein
MKRMLFAMLIVMLALSCTALADSASPRKIIIDTDTGATMLPL